VISSKKNRLVAVLLGAAFIAAGCGSSAKKATTPTTAAPKSGDTTTTAATKATTTVAPAGKAGGTVVVGAEQEPDCLDVINACAGSTWGFNMVVVTTQPRAYTVVKKGEAWVAEVSDLLAGEPTLVTSPKQVVTYKINPKAVWSTGDPITSDDFKYLWEQIAGPDAKDVYDATGYDKIESVDASKPDTVVVTFKEIYADWQALFGGGYGLEPAKLLRGKDRNTELKDGYTWSGGPWKIDKWVKGETITLIPNDKYWGKKPNLDKLVFKFTPDTSAEFQAYKAGEVQAIYPQPQIAVIDAIKAGVDGNVEASTLTGGVEGLWFNNAKAPFDVKEVRQAVGYSLDRDAIVERLFGGLKVNKASQSFSPGVVSEFAATDFSIYKKDLKKVDELLTKAGYAKGADGIYAKGGQKLTFALRTTVNNKRRELTQEVLIAQLKEAGIEMTVDNQKPGDLFGKSLPAGDFQAGLYAQTATFPVPGLSTQFLSTNIPSEANKNSGQNYTRTNIPALDPIVKKMDQELDPAARKAQGKAADKLIAESATSIPLDPLPTILLTSKKIVGAKDNAIFGPFYSSNEWSLT
jgi:peptide/nickel transport system substrate-binding protein